MTLNIAIELLKSLVLRPDGSSALQDNHFAEMEGVREESTLLLRNFYKVCMCLPPFEEAKGSLATSQPNLKSRAIFAELLNSGRNDRGKRERERECWNAWNNDGRCRCR